jgi:hypothetical protein
MHGPKIHPLAWRPPIDFAETHCTNCAAGWTRKGKNGCLTVCLLNREPVLAGMTDCDRYEPREKEPQPKPALPKRV